MKFIMNVLVILITTSVLTAQVQPKTTALPTTEPTFSNQIGAVASSISGSGLSYSYIFNDKMRFKLNGIYYYSKNNTDESDWANIGLEFQHDIFKHKIFRVYGLVGVSYWYTKDSYTYSYDPYYPTYDNSNTSNEYRIGVGIGFDLTFWSHFVIGADIGYVYENAKTTYSNPSTIPSINKYVGIGGGCTIGFLF